MNKKDFKQYMKRGLGRCVLTLRNSADIEKYKDIVLWGCLHNLSYDVQCEGTRALYVYKLTRFFDDDDYFLIPIIKAFCDSTGSLTKPFSHYLELLNYFAEDGNKTAKEALHKKYDELFVLLLNKRNFKKYDINRDNYEAICVFLISFGGKAGFLRVVRDIGRLFTENPHYDIGYFEWFCSSVRLAIGEKRIRTLLKEESKKSDYVRCFYEEYLNEEKNFNRFPKKPIEIPKLDDLKKQVLETGQL